MSWRPPHPRASPAPSRQKNRIARAMIKFPSTDYFEALKARMAAEQERFRRLGFFGATFAVKVSDNGRSRNFVLEFEVFELKNVREVDAVALKQVDFAIEGDARVWREMIENIKRHGEADTNHD